MSKANANASRAVQPMVKLGDVVDNVNDFFDRDSGEPARYIAGEHPDDGDPTVRH